MRVSATFVVMWSSGFVGAALGTRYAPADTLLGEHTSSRQRHGLALGLVGVALVVGDDLTGGTAPSWAYLLPVGGMLALSAGTVLERRWRPPEPLVVALTVQTLVAAAFFVALAAVAGRLDPPAPTGFWWAVAWVVLLSTVGGYGSYLAVLRRHGATRVSTLLYLTPPTTALWALVMFGERPGLLALAGLAVCAGAVHLVLRPSRDRATTELGSTRRHRGDSVDA